MKTAERPMSPEEVRTLVRAWFDRQIELLKKCHGKDWPRHQAWVESYLKQEIRQRLIARGWRAKP